MLPQSPAHEKEWYQSVNGRLAFRGFDHSILEESTRGRIQYYMLLQFEKVFRTELYRFPQHSQCGTDTHILSWEQCLGLPLQSP